MLAHVADSAGEIRKEYGNVSAASVGAIQRALLVLEQQGAEKFFGEPALDIRDFMRVNAQGKGVVSVLAADKLMQSPRLYATFLLWMLSELFEELPEAGDLEKPKLVFFFDEAHLLFSDASKALVDKVEQVVKLIRSKGVGVYFVTQNPMDIPESVLAQLGNRMQHALRAYTPSEQKAVKTAADSFRPNPKLDTAQVITEMGVGEALVSVLQEKGVPSVVERTLVRPPSSRLGPATPDERKAVMAASNTGVRYANAVDRESAHEILSARTAQSDAAEAAAQAEKERARQTPKAPPVPKPPKPTRTASRRSDSLVEATAKSVLRAAGSQAGRQLVRGILGSLLKGR
jgi:DNA helicase HerA-like ATPase